MPPGSTSMRPVRRVLGRRFPTLPRFDAHRAGCPRRVQPALPTRVVQYTYAPDMGAAGTPSTDSWPHVGGGTMTAHEAERRHLRVLTINCWNIEAPYEQRMGLLNRVIAEWMPD